MKRLDVIVMCLTHLEFRSFCRGIRVNAVAPGPVYTPLIPGSQNAEQMEGWAVGSAPLHGRPAQPAEMGPTYVYLADSGCSNIMTGQTLHLSHGR